MKLRFIAKEVFFFVLVLAFLGYTAAVKRCDQDSQEVKCEEAKATYAPRETMVHRGQCYVRHKDVWYPLEVFEQEAWRLK